MKLTLDVENTVTKVDNKTHFDPFEPNNKLVMVGCLTDKGEEYLYRFDEYVFGTACVGTKQKIQDLLDSATVLIGHNIVHDLLWLWECGFKYDGVVFDTMLAEYILQEGQKKPLSLEMCAERYNLTTKKQDTLKEYFKQGVGVDEIPKHELSEYLQADLHATQELSDALYKKLNTKEYSKLMDSVILTNRVALTLANIYRNGFTVDVDELHKVREQFSNEKRDIEEYLKKEIGNLMGHTPINLNSPEQLSSVIYSRTPINKAEWSVLFSPYMKQSDYNKKIKEHSKLVYKTEARKCNVCHGKGQITKTKKDGKPYAKPTRCATCEGYGYLFISRNEIAGLKFSTPSPKWVSAHGWSTSKTNLDFLLKVAKHKGLKQAEMFLGKVIRLSALDTYLSSFVDGIESHIKPDGKLHARLTQHMTATGRFSGRDPNMQNMPRGNTFPVKKVFKSRWEGGKILEADFAQLEFRTAAYLSQDEVAKKEIEDGFDVHSYTAKVITDAGQPTTRQEGKSHTFAPLYGATGFGRSQAEAKYYKQFTEKYRGIALWHSRLAKEALNTGKITTPSGRQFAFPNVERRVNGSVTYFTQIKNFPVQSFATADIVPLVLMEIESKIKDLQSCIVNTVHDSIVIDIHPDEIQDVIRKIKEVNASLKKIVDSQFSIDFNVPLLLDLKIGNNWLDTKDII
mgnify:FL=1